MLDPDFASAAILIIWLGGITFFVMGGKIMKDWKTTIFGAIEAIIIAGLTFTYGAITGDYTFTAPGLALAMARGLSGYFSKDKEKPV